MNATATRIPENVAVRNYRRETFLDLGFSEEQAELLTDARDGAVPLHHLTVKRTLNLGATHEEAMLIHA